LDDPRNQLTENYSTNYNIFNCDCASLEILLHNINAKSLEMTFKL